MAGANISHCQQSVSASSVGRDQHQQKRVIPQDQSNMTENLDCLFVPGDISDMADGLEVRVSSEATPNNAKPRNSGRGSSDNRGKSYNNTPEQKNYHSGNTREFRQWVGQSQYQPQLQARQKPMPRVVYNNRSYTRNKIPRLQPSQSSYRVPSLGALEENGLLRPSYRRRWGPNHCHAQPQVWLVHRQTMYTKNEPLVSDELDILGSSRVQIAPNICPATDTKYTSPMRAEYRAGGIENVPALMPTPFIVYNEPTSKEHFDMLLSRLRSLPMATEHENTAKISYPPNTSGVGASASTSAPVIEAMLSGKQLFEKAKNQDKTGKYDNCYWDDRMDCFVNKEAGNIGPFWKR